MSGHAARPHAAVPPSPDPDNDGPPRTVARGLRHHPVLALAALASLAVGLVHLAVAPEHEAWWPSVVFFVGLGVFQLAWAVACAVRPHSRPLLLLGALVNVAALTTWAVSRTAGMPFGPHQGEAEPMARADLLAAVLGLAVAGAAVATAQQWHPLSRIATVRPNLTTAAGGTAIAALAVVAMTGVSGHAHPASGSHQDHPNGDTVTTVSSTDQPAGNPSAGAISACKIADNGPAAKKVATTKAKKAAAAKRKATAAQCRAASLAAAGVIDPTGPRTRRGTAGTAPTTVAPAAKTPHDDSDGHQH